MYSICKDKNGHIRVDFTPEDSVKTCCFDCVYCPIGRTDVKVDAPVLLKGSSEYKRQLEELLTKGEGSDADVVLVNTNGDPLVLNDLKDYCDIIHTAGKKTAIETIGCWLDNEDIRNGLQQVDELMIELQDTSENMFRKLHRPAVSVSYSDLLKGYRNIRNWYKGHLIVAVYLVNRYNDDPDSLNLIKEILMDMKPDEIRISAVQDSKLKGLCIEESRAEELISNLKSLLD